MSWQKSVQSLGVLAVAISPALIIFSSLPPQLLAQSSSMKISLEFPPTDDRGAPGRTAGGGTRGGGSPGSWCVEGGGIPLMPLMPTRNNVGKTVADSPTLYWYIPKNTATSGEFLLKDMEGNQVYLTNFTPSRRAGIVKLSIPASAALKINKDYLWNFAIICDPQDRSQDQFVKGMLQRTELGSFLKSQLERATPLEQAKIYAESRIWHETLTIIAQLRSENPAEWEELLESVGLGAIAKKPLLDCCTAENWHGSNQDKDFGKDPEHQDTVK